MLGECKTCKVLEAQVKHLQGLLDRTLMYVAPKTDEAPLADIAQAKAEENQDTQKYGD